MSLKIGTAQRRRARPHSDLIMSEISRSIVFGMSSTAIWKAPATAPISSPIGIQGGYHARTCQSCVRKSFCRDPSPSEVLLPRNCRLRLLPSEEEQGRIRRRCIRNLRRMYRFRRSCRGCRSPVSRRLASCHSTGRGRLQAWEPSAAPIPICIHKAVASECRHAPEPGERNAGTMLLDEFCADVAARATTGPALDLYDGIAHLTQCRGQVEWLFGLPRQRRLHDETAGSLIGQGVDSNPSQPTNFFNKAGDLREAAMSLIQRNNLRQN
ncbi:hypothetical protein JOH51_006749 [Rhizobium leguminosarum]|nr:hypothetical protein [Rhizobium leguminosarum]